MESSSCQPHTVLWRQSASSDSHCSHMLLELDPSLLCCRIAHSFQQVFIGTTHPESACSSGENVPWRPWGQRITEARFTPFLTGVQRCSTLWCKDGSLGAAAGATPGASLVPPRHFSTCHGCGYTGDTCTRSTTRNTTKCFLLRSKICSSCSFWCVDNQICSNHCVWKKPACARGKAENKGESDLTCLRP